MRLLDMRVEKYLLNMGLMFLIMKGISLFGNG